MTLRNDLQQRHDHETPSGGEVFVFQQQDSEDFIARLARLAWLVMEASVLGCRLMRVLIARHLSFASHISGSDGALVEGLQQQAELN